MPPSDDFTPSTPGTPDAMQREPAAGGGAGPSERGFAEPGSDVVRGDAESDLARSPARTGATATSSGATPSGAMPGGAAMDAQGGALPEADAAAAPSGGVSGAATASGGAQTSPTSQGQPGASGQAPLFSDAQELALQWQSVQVTFVDEPRRAVQDADRLVTEMMSRLNDLFRSQQHDLEGAWNAGDEVSTEDLRVALQRYRSFFERLLSA